MTVHITIGQFLLVLMAFGAQFAICSSLYNNETDRMSLIEFRKAISLDPQDALMSWNDSTPFCNWEGVMCRTKTPPRVISLNLTNRGFKGKISPSLGNLTFLKYLVLSENAFTGYIPPSLGNHLHRLEYLHLGNNKLEGNIPNFANLSSLMLLHLGQNRLTGQIPTDLPHGLQSLSLLHNNLTGTIPASIANITKLELLDCSYNHIEGPIPIELGKLSRMQFLQLGFNKFAGSFPNAILNLSTVQGVSLAFNDLSGELPSNLGSSLPNLRKLFLAENFFGGHIPYTFFMNDSGLTNLDMSRNNLTGPVPSSIGKLTKLLKVNFELNQLEASNEKEWEFMHSLANCTELQDFSIAANSLEGHVPDSLGNLSVQLQTLYLGVNKLSGNFPFGISKFPSLIALGLHDNWFTGEIPEWLGTLKSIQLLGLQYNNFSGFIPSSLSNLSQLGNLFLDNNKFDGHLDASLGNLQMLDTFTIANNLINGMIPKEIFGIPTLRGIDLSSNNLEGQLPRQVGNAKQLVVFKVLSNKLSGDIPNTLHNCESLEYIRLDSNSFSGTIPASFGDITNLRVLNLSRNNLTGSIPLSLGDLKLLEYLDVSFNDLGGQVPTRGVFGNATAVNIDGNPSLCGGAMELHLQSCSVMHLNPRLHKKSVVKKLVIPLSVMLFLAILASVMLIWKGKQRSKSEPLPSFDKKYPKVSYKDLARATEDFSASSLIGKGRFSSVYHAKLFEGSITVAIKVFNLDTKGAPKSFMAECNALRNLRHRNLVPILTACSSIDSNQNDFKALVYEFMPGGDLHALLYSPGDDGSTSIQRHIVLTQRLCIVVDVADALEYLHLHNNQGTIVHCDVKPSNILLDENMTAHVGDFGLARFIVDSQASSSANSISSSSLVIKGTIGYIAPECAAGGEASCAGDVYSFGIVLLEIFLRKRPTDDMFKDGLNIASFVQMYFPDRISQIVDPELQQYQHDDLSQEASAAMRERTFACLISVLDIGLHCTKASPSERMDMREVAARLHGVKDAYLRGNRD